MISNPKFPLMEVDDLQSQIFFDGHNWSLHEKSYSFISIFNATQFGVKKCRTALPILNKNHDFFLKLLLPKFIMVEQYFFCILIPMHFLIF